MKSIRVEQSTRMQNQNTKYTSGPWISKELFGYDRGHAVFYVDHGKNSRGGLLSAPGTGDSPLLRKAGAKGV